MDVGEEEGEGVLGEEEGSFPGNAGEEGRVSGFVTIPMMRVGDKEKNKKSPMMANGK